MAVAQYIGARYVPLFFTNPNDNSNNWLSGIAYDPLTIVTDLNQSYTSKKPVPATVGRPSENPDYWIMTGAYNAQIEQYRQEVENLEDDFTELSESVDEKIENVKARKYVFLSDSYGTFHTDEDNYNFVQLACAFNQLTENTDYYQFYISGCGFCAEAPHQFVTLLQDNDSVITDKTAITDIVVFGSANDQLGSYNTIRSGITNLWNYARNNYPNAKIHIACLSKSLETADLINNLPTVYRAYHDAIDYNIDYIVNSEFIMSWFALYRSDALHPTEAAIDSIGRIVAHWINSGTLNVHRTLTANDLFDTTNAAYIGLRPSSTQPYIKMVQNNGTVTAGCGAHGILMYARMKAAKTFVQGTTALNNELEMIDSLFYPNTGYVTTWYGSMWHGNNRYGIILTIKADDIRANGKKAKCQLIVENTLGADVTINAGENVSLIFPQPLTVSM